MLRDERTPEARRNQRIVLPLALGFFALLVAGLVAQSEALFAVGGGGFMLAGAAWRWV